MVVNESDGGAATRHVVYPKFVPVLSPSPVLVVVVRAFVTTVFKIRKTS